MDGLVQNGGRDDQGLQADSGGRGLRRDALGVIDVAFFIIAAASPLTGVIAIVPIMIGIGNGIGSPAAFLMVVAILILFAIGYVEMSRQVRNAGALYSYVTLGLGQITGLGTAALIIFSYSAIQFGLYGGFGYYVSELIASLTGVHIAWWACAMLAAIFCLILSVRGVHSGARVLGASLMLECLLLVLLSIGILKHGPVPGSSFSLNSLGSAALMSPGVGVGLMLACATFIGFEGGAIYSEEARSPEKTIPCATYCSLLFMAAVYSGVTWLLIWTLGTSEAVAIARHEGGNLVFVISDRVLGHWATRIFNLFIVSAIFAALVTFHNNIARYLYSLGRQGLVWAPLGNTRPVARTPHIACIVQTASAVLAILIFAALRLDPYAILFASMTGMGAIGIILAQNIAAVAIFVFFRRTSSRANPFNTIFAPLLAVAGLIMILYYALNGFDLLVGVTGMWAKLLAGTVFAVFALGAAYGLAVKRAAPERYRRIAQVLME